MSVMAVDDVAAAGEVVVLLVVDAFLAVAARLARAEVHAEVAGVVLVEVEPLLEVVAGDGEGDVPMTLPSLYSSMSKPSSRSPGSNLPLPTSSVPNMSTRTSPAPRSSTSMPSAALSAATVCFTVMIRSPSPPSFTRRPSRSETL